MRLPAILALSFLASSLTLTPSQDTEDSGSKIEWANGNFEPFMQRIQGDGKLVFVYIWADGGEQSQKFWNETIVQSETEERLSKMHCYSAQAKMDSAQELIKRFGVKLLPACAFIDSDGRAQDALHGYLNKGAFLIELDRILAGEGTLGDLEAKVAAAKKPKDAEALDLRYQLAAKHYALGDAEKHDELLAAIREDDPKAKTLAGVRAHLIAVAQEVADRAGSEDFSIFRTRNKLQFNGDPSRWDRRPYIEFAESVKNKEGLFEVWDNIGLLALLQNDIDGATKAWTEAYDNVPKERLLAWGDEKVNYLVPAADAGGSKTRKFALELAEELVKLSGKADATDEEVRYAFGDLTQNEFLAGRLRTLALAQAANRDMKDAIKTLEKAKKLHPEGAWDELIALFERDL